MRKLMYKDEEVVYIEYKGRIPFAALTAPLTGRGLTDYHFEFVYGNKKDIRFRSPGFGGDRMELPAPQQCTYWVAPGCKFKGRPKKAIRLDKPLRVSNGYRSSINPFIVCDETSYHFDYCKYCDQFTCDGEGCHEHQEWSDEKSSLVYIDDQSLVE